MNFTNDYCLVCDQRDRKDVRVVMKQFILDRVRALGLDDYDMLSRVSRHLLENAPICGPCYSGIAPAPAGPVDDPVSHPAHYTFGKLEVIDVIEDWGWGLDFCLGNVIKYVARAGRKDPTKLVEDLEKARWYFERAIAIAKKG